MHLLKYYSMYSQSLLQVDLSFAHFSASLSLLFLRVFYCSYCFITPFNRHDGLPSLSPIPSPPHCSILPLSKYYFYTLDVSFFSLRMHLWAYIKTVMENELQTYFGSKNVLWPNLIIIFIFHEFFHDLSYCQYLPLNGFSCHYLGRVLR